MFLETETLGGGEPNDPAGTRMTKTNLSLFMVIGLILVLPTPAWADLQAAGDAFERGDYTTALKEFRPLAEKGLMEAQYVLGFLFDQLNQAYVDEHTKLPKGLTRPKPCSEEELPKLPKE